MAPPLVIPLFIPHSGCPHHCVFCDQTAITSQTAFLPGPDQIRARIQAYLQYAGKRTRVEVGFFGGNFLGLSMEAVQSLLALVQPWLDQGKVQGIRCSTRPDTVTREKLDQIRDMGVSLVELGVQSMNDRVLDAAGRGHTQAHTREAVACLKAAGIQVGVQVMAGLPEETREGLLQSTREVADLAPDLARIYPLVVFEGTVLARWYDQGRYTPMDLDSAVARVKEMVQIFEHRDVPVVRMGLQASAGMEEKIVAGPWHPALGHLVRCAQVFDKVCERLGKKFSDRTSGQVTLGVHPRFESRLRGDRNRNMERLSKQYPGLLFCVAPDPGITPGKIQVKYRP